jgi:hypothetical protein
MTPDDRPGRDYPAPGVTRYASNTASMLRSRLIA